MADTSHNDDHEEGEEPKKGKKKLLFIIIAVVLLLGAGAGLFFSGMLDSLLGGKPEEAATEEAAPAEGEEAAHGEAKGKDGKAAVATVAYYSLPEIVTDLNPGSAESSFIKAKITIEAPSQEMVTKIQAVQPKIMDIIHTYLRELRASDLKGSMGTYRLRDELLLRVNKALYPDQINNILFEELLIQ